MTFLTTPLMRSFIGFDRLFDEFDRVSNFSENITMTGIALKMASVVTVPVAIGMLIRKFADNLISNNTIFCIRYGNSSTCTSIH